MAPQRLEVLLLGPVAARTPDGDAPLGGVLARAVLALLALEPGRTVGLDSLVDGLWGDALPHDPRASLQSHVSRLRRVLGPGTLTGVRGGYRIDVRAENVDATAVRRAAPMVRARSAGEPEAAAELAERLAGMWRGPALADVRHLPGLAAAAAGLDDLRLSIVEDRAEALVAAGHATVALTDLSGPAAEHPLRERLHALTVRALHADGRTAEALAAADSFRSRLAQETGLDPGEELVAAREAALRAAPRRRTGNAGSAGVSARLGAFVGRDAELADLAQAVAEPGVVTVMGPGGVGKTRLVDELLAARAGTARPVMAVELADVEDSADVVPAIGSTLRLGGQLSARAVVEYLSVGRSLLVLDNCEHVLDGVRPLVRRVLGGAPGTTVLATSRVRLGLPGERVVRLAPLPSADDGTGPAVAMLLDRYERAGGPPPDAPQVAAARSIARTLDGLPLALELAAARAATLGLVGLDDRLAEDLSLLDDALDAPRRHSGLDALLGWSLRLLDAPTRDAFEVLSIFEGGFTVDAGEAVIADVLGGRGAAAIAALVDASLVVRDEHRSGDRIRSPDAPARLRVPEPMRERARATIGDRLPVARTAHLRWVVNRLEGVGPDADDGGVESFGVAAVERANTRAAVRWAVEREDPAAASRLAAALGRVYLTLVRLDPEAVDWTRRLVEMPGSAATPTAIAALAHAALGAVTQGQDAAGRALADRALALVDDGADSTGVHVAWQAQALRLLYAGDTRSRAWWARVLADDTLAPFTHQGALQSLALSHVNAGEAAAARAHLERARILDDIAATRRTQAWFAYVEGEVLRAEGDGEAAMAALRRAIDAASDTGDDFVVGVAGVSLVSVLARTGLTREAAARLPAVLDFWRRGGAWPQQWTTLRVAAEVLVDAGDPGTALLLVDAADRAADSPGVTGPDVARLAAVRGRAIAALGPTETRRTIATAAVLPRVRVIERALQALAVVDSGLPAV